MKNILSKYVYGFSLLEVMIALLLFAISFTSLMLVQTRATNLAINTKNISLSTAFARMKLNECKGKVKKIIPSISDFKEEGNFADLGYEKFSWECHAPRFSMSHLSAQDIEKSVKNETPEALKTKNNGISSSVMQMITDGLSEAVRELVVIIRWKENNIDEETRVVTHVTDVNAMARLSLMLGQGAKMTNKNTTPPGEKPKEEVAR